MRKSQSTQTGEKRVAIVHDWLIGGGAEKVVEQLHIMYPEAPIYTSYCNDEWRKKLNGKVVTGWLQNWPFSRLRKFLPVLRIWWFTHLDLSRYDLVISSSGAEAKGIKTSNNTLHVNYCHAPTHYYWSRYNEYIKNPGFGALNWLARFGLKLLLGPLRTWDYKAAQRPDYIIANSSHIQKEIKQYYNRDSVVIHPPVDIEAFKPVKELPRRGFVIAGRQTHYKRFDLAVTACTKLSLPLTVIGEGPEHENLKRIAGPTITFMGHTSFKDLVHSFQSAQALIFPGLDDFGITAVEALSAGTPVIAYKAGGALDYVKPGINGEFFTKQNVESLANVLTTFDSKNYDTQAVSQSAARFSAKHFMDNLASLLHKTNLER